MHALLQLQLARTRHPTQTPAGAGPPVALVLSFRATQRGHMPATCPARRRPDETLGCWPLSQPGAGAGEQQPARLRPAELHVERVPRVEPAGPERREPRLGGVELVRRAGRLQHVLQGLAQRLRLLLLVVLKELRVQQQAMAVVRARRRACRRLDHDAVSVWEAEHLRRGHRQRRRRGLDRGGGWLLIRGALRLHLELGYAVRELVRVLLQLHHQRLQTKQRSGQEPGDRRAPVLVPAFLLSRLRTFCVGVRALKVKQWLPTITPTTSWMQLNRRTIPCPLQ